jgi:hypothetical protein
MLDQLLSTSWSIATAGAHAHHNTTTAGRHETARMALDEEWPPEAALRDGRSADSGLAIEDRLDDRSVNPAAILEQPLAAGHPDGLSAGHIGLLLYLGIVFLVAVALNLSLLLVFVRKPSLRTTSNRFILLCTLWVNDFKSLTYAVNRYTDGILN